VTGARAAFSQPEPAPSSHSAASDASKKDKPSADPGNGSSKKFWLSKSERLTAAFYAAAMQHKSPAAAAAARALSADVPRDAIAHAAAVKSISSYVASVAPPAAAPTLTVPDPATAVAATTAPPSASGGADASKAARSSVAAAATAAHSSVEVVEDEDEEEGEPYLQCGQSLSDYELDYEVESTPVTPAEPKITPKNSKTTSKNANAADGKSKSTQQRKRTPASSSGASTPALASQSKTPVLPPPPHRRFHAPGKVPCESVT